MASHYLQDKMQTAYVLIEKIQVPSWASSHLMHFHPLLWLYHVNTSSCLFSLQITPCSYVVFLSFLHSTCSKWWITIHLSRVHSTDTSRPLRMLIIPFLKAPYHHVQTFGITLKIVCFVPDNLLSTLHAYVNCLSLEPYQISAIVIPFSI